MKCNCKSKLPILSILAIIGGVLGIIGWYFNDRYFLSVLPGWHEMRFTSAALFIMSGLILLSVDRIIHADHKNQDLAPFLLSAASLIILLFLSFFTMEKFFGIPLDAEEIFIGKLASLGQMSTLTAINFFIVAIIGLMAMFKPKWFRLAIFLSGIVLAAGGLAAILGYLFKASFLYFNIPHFSGPMSLVSAIIFLIIGAGFLLLGICSDISNISSLFYFA